MKEKISDLIAKFDKGGLIGVDIGLSAVKIASVSISKKNIAKLESFISIPLDEAVIIEDEIQKPEAVIEAIMTGFKSLKIRKKIVCIGISGANTVTKRLQVAGATKEELEDNVLWEAEQYIPFGIEESDLDFEVIQDQKDKEIKDVFVVAARSDVAEKRIEVIKEAGLLPRVIDLNALAISNLFEFAYRNELVEISERGAIILDFGAQKTTVIVYKNNAPILTREIPYGGILISEEIQRQMGLSYFEAEDLKTSGDGKGNLTEEIMSIVELQLDKIVGEVQKIINFYTAAGSSDQVKYCFTTGGNSLLPGFKERLEQKLRLEVRFLNPFEGIEFNRKAFNDEDLTKVAATGVVAIGLGLRATT